MEMSVAAIFTKVNCHPVMGIQIFTSHPLGSVQLKMIMYVTTMTDIFNIDAMIHCSATTGPMENVWRFFVASAMHLSLLVASSSVRKALLLRP